MYVMVSMKLKLGLIAAFILILVVDLTSGLYFQEYSVIENVVCKFRGLDYIERPDSCVFFSEDFGTYFCPDLEDYDGGPMQQCEDDLKII